MLSDGTHSYGWDARNHLATIDGGSTASFVYDLAGRRATKVISGTQTNFLYDLANPVQELSGTTPASNLLGGGLDQYFTRTDANGTTNFLTDALGSTVALADTTGVVQTQYTFDPFGGTAQTGTLNTNSFAYTGRENDGTGLYYYRARYYDPQIGRFISEDPIGFGGGLNFYAYVTNSPGNLTDPLGLCANKPDCPAVPQAPPGVDINDNIKDARLMQFVTYTDPALSLYLFKKMVGNKMPWDYKQYGWTLTDTGQLGPSPYQEFGNFNFGATGAAWGIPLNVLQRAAGYAQGAAGTSTPEWGHWHQGPPYGDDPDDQAQIIAGYNYYKNACYK